jgi:hypothetical protein
MSWLSGLCIGGAGACLVLGVLSAEAVSAGAVSACDEREAPRTAGPRAAEPVRYDRDVRPILADRCFKCHGPDEAAREAELRLDVAESALADRGGYAALVPGDVEASELWYRITTDDPRDRMPPPKSGKRALSDEERDVVRRWLEAGAAYEPHWSFVPPVRPALPEVGDANWCKNPVDRFVLEKLEREGLAPSPPADRETLLRRVFLDLTGLPPTPEEQAQFLADERADAYELWVERLLHEEPYSTRHAERMATPWLDAARYADTSGIHMDAGRQIWPWRDWLLGALRDGMPYDCFVTEQLAGDLLPDATQATRTASGFNRNHVTSDEGGAIDAEYRVEYAVDRTATTGTVFLGLTLGCARCHEHKFDPVSQEDFYRLYAFFDSNEEPGVYSQVPDANRALEPFLEVPTPEQAAERARLTGELDAARAELERPIPGEEGELAAFLAETPARLGAEWVATDPTAVRSAGDASLAVQDDGSILATGANPDVDEHHVVLRTEATGLRLILLEALGDPSAFEGRVGRAENGNAVLSELRVEAVSLADPARRVPLAFSGAWADVEQEDGDFDVVNALDGGDERGWAVAAHQVPGDRAALFLAAEPFGFEGGTEVRVTLSYRSIYARHAFARVRLTLGRLGPQGLERLPVADSRWSFVGPFPAADSTEVFERAFGPEEGARIDRARNFGFGNQYWRFAPDWHDGRENGDLPEGLSATYVGKRLFVPSARKLELSLGSDDGLRVFLDGVEVFQKRVDRSLARDQDRVTLDLAAGEHDLVLKVVNTGGEAGFYVRPLPPEDELAGALAWVLAPERVLVGERRARLAEAWHVAFSPAYRVLAERVQGLEAELARLVQAIPRTMVMQELAEPRPTYLLARGLYDHPVEDRPLERGVPAALGGLPDGAPRNRLGLAQWLTAPENPLVARVEVNRLWELVFGQGIVRTSEDFGQQGDWPSHPELLDWLAVEFREGGWDVKELLRLLVTSSTYRQDSRVRPDARERDPENRWLASFPRKRLSAEAIRDSALYVSGLLVERFGGPSVKPYQPEGLWQEVAMVQSNTREYVQGTGADLWRRSVYTYWKRASPPPAMLALDAPTREFCQVRRPTTNTPLQALVVWNDVQFVEAARALASRTLAEAASDEERLARMVRRVACRAGDAAELASLAEALAEFRRRFGAAPEDAQALLAVGEAPAGYDGDPAELAAWTLVASALLALDETLTRS